MSAVVRVRGVTKSFGGAAALKGVDLDLYPGEVHALMGMNGAGKSTLVQILSGAHQPDGGTIQVNGATYSGLTVRRARRLGIASVPQRRELAMGLTVADNVMLGDLPTRRGTVHWKAVNSEARKALSGLGIDIDVERTARSLTVAEQTMVEVAREVRRGGRILILDEPTACLSAEAAHQIRDLVRTAEISEALIPDPRLAALTFTGSNEVGEALRGRLANSNIRFQGELGGKNATVVLADADLTAAAKAVAAAGFAQAGQRCTATSRVIVERPVYEEFTALLLAEATALRVGPGLAEGTTMGPLVSARQRDGVLSDIERAVKQGATVLVGGDQPGDEALRHGCYVNPTVLGDLTPELDIWREEVFGPVVVLLPVDSFEEAVEAVNDSVFGLAAAVFTQNLGAAYRFADEAECGQIAVNATTSGWDVHHPFGGFCDSGSPFKEQGEEALRFYTRVKTVAVHFGA
ncbi:aldehyde dehydrogenase family protein [Streptomyces mirabilis]